MQKSNKKQKLTPGGEAETNVRKCSTVLKALQRNPRAGAFLMPVDWKALKLPQYPKMIKTPMDLGTVEQKLNDGRYKTIRDWADDIRLVWSNACTFNTEGSDVFELATQLSSDFEGRLDGLPMSGSLREAGGGGRGGMQPDELSACKAALKEIRKHKDAAPFLDPVDWKALGIPDYPTIIKRPMDLGTVMQRLESNEYDSVANLSEEINLVWNNAMTYNMDDSWIHQSARGLKAFADKKMAPLLGSSRGGGYSGANEPTELTFEMKQRLNDNANLLSSKDLYGMVGIVEENCKAAVDQSNPAEVEIDIDSLDLPTFLKVDKYVRDCIMRAKKKA
eukprot:Transcript_11421.p1 GENE.Transcript_11421~~Transcript_11421.p1  ORF type:complete len:334 (-),score=185.93 Transcript_11421:186-1187(-)